MLVGPVRLVTVWVVCVVWCGVVMLSGVAQAPQEKAVVSRRTLVCGLPLAGPKIRLMEAAEAPPTPAEPIDILNFSH